MSRVRLSTGIVTDDPDPLLRFYARGLGFELESTSDFPQGVVHRLRREDAHCKLYAPAGGAASPPAPEPWHRDRGFAYAALHVDDVDGTVEQARAAGGKILVEPTAHRAGARYALVADPQGNVWELLEER